MYYSCRSFIGNHLDNTYSQFWENKKRQHLFGLIFSPNLDTIRQTVDTINQNYESSLKTAFDNNIYSKLGLLLFNDNQINIIATDDIYIALKRSDKINIFPLTTGQIITGKISNLDQFAVSNSREFLINLLSLPSLSNVSIPDNVSAFIVEIHTENTKIITQNRPRIPSHVKPSRYIFRYLFIILFLLSTAYFSYRYLNHFQKQKKNTQENNLITAIKNKIETSQKIKNIDLETSAKEASLAAALLNELKTKFKNNDQINSLEKSINELSNPLTSFYDTKIINESAKYSKMISSKDGLYLLDSTAGRLDYLSFSKSKKEISKSEKLKSIIDIALDRDKLYGLSLDKVYLLNGLDFDELSTLKTTPIDFQVWNGSVYILTTTSIEKLNSSTPWLSGDQKFPSLPTSIAINGKIWVLSGDGKLTPYLRGKQDKFSPSEKLSLQNATNLVTSLSSQDLYFSDQKNIYVFDKTGKLIAKPSLFNLNIIDISIDFATSQIYVLASDQKIYRFNL